MGRHVWRGWILISAAALVLSASACSDDNGGGTTDAGIDTGDMGGGTVMVSDDIATDTTWTSDNIYELTTDIFVEGATLTIEAGTRVVGQDDSALIVTTTGRIDAQGTASDPVVFTSTTAPDALPGDWGGVVLLGNATINTTDGGGGTNNIEGIDPAEGRGVYGGSDDTHDCGTLRYVRIEFAGREVTEGNELNGLTMGGCGSDTVLEYIQVHRGADDAIEFFGGTADIRYFVASQGEDDGLDWQLGWTGRAQFGIIQQGVASEHGIEADNFENGNDNEPRSAPDVSNLTIVGANDVAVEGEGMRLRRGTAGQIFNTIVVGFRGGDAVDIRDQSTVTQLTNGDLVLGSLIFDRIGESGTDWYPTGDEGDADHEPVFGCDTEGGGLLDNIVCDSDPRLADPFNPTDPSFVPATDGPADNGVVPNDNGFFDTTADYIGAIEPGGTDWTEGWTNFGAPEPGRVEVSGNIGSDTSWTADNVYVLTQDIFVEGGATLSIAAGTRIEGQSDSALIVTTEGRIEAEGTASDPVLFTSTTAPNALPGDWGGVVLLGNATINTTDGGGGSNNIEGIDPAEDRGVYGGSDDTHDCGTMRYVRIEFAGREVTEGNELNGLTMGGCGSDTVLEYIQVHKGADDAIEFFGGTADIRYFVTSQGEDDGLDWQLGWRGRAQFGIIQQGNASEHGIEADNFENGNDNEPRSNPAVSNLTIVGAGDENVEGDGMRLRRGTAGLIINTMVTSFNGGDSVDIRDSSTLTQLTNGDLDLSSIILFDIGSSGTDWYPDDPDHEPFFGCDTQGGGSLSNIVCDEDPELGDPFSLTAPDFVPASTSPAATGETPPDDGFFDTSADYIGAIEPGGTDWSAGWTDYP